MQKLAELHPQADPPEVDVSDTTPVHITAEILAKVLQRLPRGSSGGPSGWTYEHINAACVAMPVHPMSHWSDEPQSFRQPPRHP